MECGASRSLAVATAVVEEFVDLPLGATVVTNWSESGINCAVDS